MSSQHQKKGSLTILEEGNGAATTSPYSLAAGNSNDGSTRGESSSSAKEEQSSGPSPTDTKEKDGDEVDSEGLRLPRKRNMTKETASSSVGLGGAGPPRRATMLDTDGKEIQPGFSRTLTTLLTPEHRLAPAPNYARSITNVVTYSWLNILLIFIPVSWALHFALPAGGTTNSVVVFVTACECRASPTPLHQ